MSKLFTFANTYILLAISRFAIIEEMALAYLVVPTRKFNLKITSMMLIHNVAKFN